MRLWFRLIANTTQEPILNILTHLYHTIAGSIVRWTFQYEHTVLDARHCDPKFSTSRPYNPNESHLSLIVSANNLKASRDHQPHHLCEANPAFCNLSSHT
jgi:hypothetical protein